MRKYRLSLQSETGLASRTCKPLGFTPKRYVEDRDREKRVPKGLDLVAQDGQENGGVAGSGEEIRGERRNNRRCSFLEVAREVNRPIASSVNDRRLKKGAA